MTNRRKGQIGLLIVAIIWGSGFVFSSIALDYFSPYQILAMRFVTAFGILTILFRKQFKYIDLKIVKKGSILGVFLYLAFLFQTVGLVYTTPSKNAFLTAFNVVLVPFIMAVFFKKKMNASSLLGAALSIIGIAIMSLNEFNMINFGDVLTLVCALFFALHIIYTKEYVGNENIYLLTTIQMAAASILGIIVALLSGEQIVIEGYVGIASVVYLGAVSTMLAFLLQTASQRFTKGTETAIILSTESVYGMIFSAIIINEIITGRMLIGAVLILAGVLTVELNPTTIKGMNLNYVNKKKANYKGYRE